MKPPLTPNLMPASASELPPAPCLIPGNDGLVAQGWFPDIQEVPTNTDKRVPVLGINN
ncbi:hypothetical protein DSO57_1012474 [Entomophthora muscae]|uniref:Uncharacterized protein n=1 Tax=Entomophthora muscae TaxID=34485 RepID=A0ACC2TT81_9FUNG|nr:hypothetical protein DSO57_1012474 [Entomophthora muscae]